VPNILYAVLIALVIGFGAGWKTDSWYNASQVLAERNAIDKSLKVFAAKESTISKFVEVQLRGLKANERVIERFTKEVTERPVYFNTCLDDDGLRIINAYGTANSDSGKLIGEVP